MQQLNPGQVKKYLKQLRERKDQYLYYLGELAFQAGETGALEEGPMLEAYRTLKDIMGQITQWEEYLERMRAAKEAAQQPRCPRCGAAVLRGAAFCPSCGTPLSAPAAPVVPGMAPAAPGMQPPAAPGMPPQVAVPPQGGPMPPGAAPGPYVAPAPAAPPPPSPQPAAPPSAPAGGAVTVGKTCAVCAAPLDEDALFCGNCGSRVDAGPATAPTADVPAGYEVTAAAQAPAGGAVAEEAAKPGTTEAGAETGPAGEAVVAGGAEPVSAAPAPAACPGCGATVDDAEALFCPNCGARLRP